MSRSPCPQGIACLGYGAGVSTLQAVAPWIGNGGPNDAEAVVHNNGQPGVAVKSLTIDANNLSTFGIGAHGQNMMVDSVMVKNAKCDGISNCRCRVDHTEQHYPEQWLCLSY